MQIKVIDAKMLEKRHAYWGYCVSPPVLYEVLAIKKYNKHTQYLVEDNMRLNWWDADLFNVIEETIPNTWIEVRYKHFYKMRNKNYDFSIHINYFCGPSEFLENKNFLFDIYENPKAAYIFYTKEKTKTGDASLC